MLRVSLILMSHGYSSAALRDILDSQNFGLTKNTFAPAEFGHTAEVFLRETYVANTEPFRATGVESAVKER